MAEALLADDIEAALISNLGPVINVPVSTRVPHDRPDEFVRLQRLGGTRRDLILDEPMIGFWCWAPTTVRASLLARTTEARVFALEGLALGGTFVYRVQAIAGTQVTADPDSDTPLGIFTVQLTTRLLPL